MALKQLLKTTDDWRNLVDGFERDRVYCGIFRTTPESFPVLAVWEERDLSMSMSHGWEALGDYVYLEDFEER